MPGNATNRALAIRTTVQGDRRVHSAILPDPDEICPSQSALLFQPTLHLSQGAGAVAKLVFDVGRQHAKTPIMSVGHEKRIVPKAAFAVLCQ